MNKCKNCQYWKEDKREERAGGGTCRRFPPQITTRVYTNGATENAGRYEPEVESSIETAWPQTTEIDWCGEHKHVGTY